MEYEIIDGIHDLISDSNKDELEKLFLSRITFSFFIFQPQTKWDNKFDWSTLESDFKTVVSELLRHDSETSIETIERSALLDKLIFKAPIFFENEHSYLFPFLQTSSNPFQWYVSTNKTIKPVLEKFTTTDFFFIHFVPFDWKLLVFTNVDEESVLVSFQNLKNYKILDLGSIIPKVIDTLISRIGVDKNVWLNELWIGFPLSMLWWHWDIRDKPKNWSAISHDPNFRNLIKYWLLNYLKLQSEYTITFYKDNERNKLNLRWRLMDEKNGLPNASSFEKLRKFLSDIDAKEELLNDFFWLPIYIIHRRLLCVKSDEHPIVQYSISEQRLLLKIDSSESEESFIINWIFPQYIKISPNKTYSYLKEKENSHPWLKSDWLDTWYFKWEENLQTESCEVYLQYIRDELSKYYHYIPDTNEIESTPHLMQSDIFFLACWKDNKIDYLINISDSKKNRPNEHSLVIEIYKLSSFHYWWDKIRRDVLWFQDIHHPHVGDMYIDKDRKLSTVIEFNSNKRTINLSPPIPPWNWKCDTRKVPQKDIKEKIVSIPFDCKDIIGLSNRDKFMYEDYLSCCVLRLLEMNWHKAFFWGKAEWNRSRELADVISLKETLGDASILELNLFHNKTYPFDQIKTSNLGRSFAEYTQVVGQALEKTKSFIDFKSMNDIVDWLEYYFMYTRENWDSKTKQLYDPTKLRKDKVIVQADNYEIFTQIKNALLWKTQWTICINIIFPIRKDDYFALVEDIECINVLAMETNWKRLKMISEIFKSNVDFISNTITPDLKIKLNLWVMLVHPSWRDEEWRIKNELRLITDVTQLFRT